MLWPKRLATILVEGTDVGVDVAAVCRPLAARIKPA